MILKRLRLPVFLIVATGLLGIAARTPAGTRHFPPVVSAGAVLVIAQAIARMYLGVHYPTDVIGSMLAATAGTSAVIALRGGVDRRAGRMSAR